MRPLGLVLLALGVLFAGGAYYVLGEVERQCSTDEAQFGRLLGHPEAQKCDTYPTYANAGMLAGLVVAGVGLLLALRPRPA